jgi:tetratricopeptide (TPR) repeat protein
VTVTHHPSDSRVSSARTGTIVLFLLVLCAVGFGIYVGTTYYLGHRAHEQAKKLVAESKLDKARALLAKYCTDWPRDADGHFLAARTSRRLRDFADADAHLRQCRDLGFDADKLQLEYAMMQAQRDTPEAVEGFLLAQVKQDHGDYPEILEALIQGYLKTFQMHKALHCVRLWRQRDVDDLQMHFWAGMVLEKSGEARDALATFEIVVGDDPENREARLHLADLLLGVSKDYERALQHYERLQSTDPDNMQVVLGMVGCKIGLNQLEEAGTLLDKLRTVHPVEPRVLSECGQLALRLNKPKEAAEDLGRAVTIDPYEPNAVYAYSQALRQLGRVQEAEEYEKKHVAIRADLDRLDELSRTVTEQPRDADLRHEMGVIFLRNGRELEGVAWLTTALQVNPQHGPSHRALADYFERKGMKREAAEHKQR